MRVWEWFGVCVVTAMSLVGCSGPATTICAPGATRECRCAGGAGGVQTCNEQGSGFGACSACPDGGGPPADACSCEGVMCGLDSCRNPTCGVCPSGQYCSDGVCMRVSAGPCSRSNPAGECPAGQTCRDGTCACVANCTGRMCGPDGCGGSCGTCPLAGWACDGSGQCVSGCPTCGSRRCGPNPMCPETSCGTCPSTQRCNAAGQCEAACTPNCTGRVCGPDGCMTGGTCGACPAGATCNAAGRCETTCPRNCTGRVCGNDGCGGTCGTCPAGFTCNSAQTGCDVDPASTWIVRATTGMVSSIAPGGGGWDPDGSAPDPLVCLTINGTQACTPYINNAFTPRWDYDFAPTTARALMMGVPNAFWDDDVGFDDAICAMGTVAITAADLRSGSRTLRCEPYGTFTLTFRPR